MSRISAYSRNIWTIKGLITTGIFLIIAVGLNISLEFNVSWKYLITWGIYAVTLIFLLDSLFISKYRYKKYRYEMDRAKVILRYGVVNEKNLVIPMKMVNHVDIKQGLLLKKYKLVNLMLHTAGGYYVIPYLDIEVGKRAKLSIEKIIQERSI